MAAHVGRVAMRVYGMTCALLLLWGGVAARAMAADAKEVLVEGKGIRVERGEVEAEVQRLRTEATQRGQWIEDDQWPALRRQVLERLTMVRMFEARATSADRSKAEESARTFIEGLRRTQGEEGLARLLRQAGYTNATFRAAKVSEALVSAVIDREVRPTVRIPTSDIRDYYEKNASQWEQPAAVRVQNLLLSMKTADGKPLGVEALAARRQRMREIKAEADRGADFAALVRQHSQDEGSKARGGEYRIEKGLWPEELEKEVFALEPGKVCGPIETYMGLHVVKVLERIPARRLPLADVEEDIRKLLTEREVQQRVPEFIDRVRMESGLRRLAEP
jgi:parvulin-like peptidyl-prolyl isomerase